MRKSFFILILSFFCLFFIHAQNLDDIIYSHLPGVYNKDITLDIHVKNDYRIFINFTPQIEGNWVFYKEPLELSALKGEERSYTVGVRIADNSLSVIEERELKFIIDKKLPETPEITPNSGEFTEDLYVTFTAEEDVYYCINGNIFTNSLLWDGSRIPLICEPGEKETYIVQAYTRDNAGNRSNVVSFDYTINRRQSENLPPELKILSPVPGDFANYQLLYIKSLNIKWINYTVDGRDPVTFGIPYNQPVNLIESGEVQLRIAAGTMSGEIITDQVNYSVSIEPQGRIISDVKSGVYDRSLSINLFSTLSNELYYTFSETSPGLYDYIYEDNIVINAIENTEKYSTLRIKAKYPDGGWSDDYRFFFSIKKISSNEGSDNTDTDNNIVIPDSNISSLLSLEEFVGQYISSNEEESLTEEETLELIYQRIGELIKIELSDYEKTNMPVTVSIEKPDKMKLVYEISVGSPVIPSLKSPEAYDDMKISVPFGMEQTYVLNFAVIENNSIYLVSEPYYIYLDKLPPQMPEIKPEPGSVFDDSIILEISGSGKMLYEITNDNTTPEDPDEESSAYTEPIQLLGRNLKLVTYYIKIKSIDDIGNESEIAGPYKFTIDRRTPELPLVRGLQEGRIYNDHISVEVNTEYVNVHYSLVKAGDEAVMPDSNSPIIDEELIIDGEPDSFTDYTLYLIPYSKNYKQVGEISSITFSIDMERPGVPVASGFIQGMEYNIPVEVTLEPVSEEDIIYVSYTYNGENVPDPVENGEQYIYPLLFDVDENEEAVIRLRFVAVDKYGNRSHPDESYYFTIDKKPPAEPVVAGIPENGVSKEPVKIELLSGDGDIYFNVTEDGSIPEPPPVDLSFLYNSSMLFIGRDGEEIQYKIVTRGVDVLGNIGKSSRVFSFIIDRKSPEAPPEPEVSSIYENDENKILISWNVPAGHRLFYSYSDNLTDEEVYKYYIDPVIIHLGEGIYNFSIDYYLEDIAGNKSEEISYAQRLSSVPSLPEINGVENGEVYNSPVTLDIISRSGILRYELTVDGSEPQEVTKTSPVLSSPITFDADAGEILNFNIKVCAFDSINPNIHSAENHINFIIDKQMPSVPLITGIADKGNYQETRIIEMQADDGLIYYALKKGEEIIHGITDEDFIPYTSAVEVTGEENKSIPYVLEAYVIDKSGNRSIRNLRYEFTIDRVAIYVSAFGNDGYSGTKRDPLRSLNIAVQYAESKNIDTILISSGTFQIDDTLFLKHDIDFTGGLDFSTWEKTQDKTIINVTRYYNNERPMIQINDSNINIDSIIFEEDYNSDVNIIMIENSSVNIKDSEIVINNKNTGNGIIISGGSLILENVKFRSENTEAGSLLKASGSEINIKNAEFKSNNTGMGVILSDLENSTAGFTDVIFNPGTGRITRSIIMENSSVDISSCSIYSGSGTQNSICINSTLSTLNISQTEIRNDISANYCVSILSSDSNIFMENTDIYVESSMGATAMKINGGSLFVSLCRILGGESHEFIYLADIKNADVSFYNNILTCGNSENTVCAIINNSSSDWFNNTIIGGTGSGKTSAFIIENSPLTKIINNIITRGLENKGTALILTGEFPQEIRTNCISGWNNICSTAENSFDKNKSFIASIDDFNSMDSNSVGGGIHGNIDESFYEMFMVTKQFEYYLNSSSKCINNGTDISSPPYNGPSVDMEGEKRPAPEQDIAPRFDIGADEYY